jgi:signal peptidase I
MTQAAETRGKLGLFLISFLLGPPSVMLWIGRWRLALVYFVLYFVMNFGFFALFIFGLAPLEIFARFDPMIVVTTPTLIVSAIAFAHALRLRETSIERPWYSRWYFALPTYSALGYAIALLVSTFILQPFNIPSFSGVPNLMVGDYVFVSKTAYGQGELPERGDLAVFKLHTNIDYVKRVVGLPGDRIQMIHGVLHINDAPVKLEQDSRVAQYYHEMDLKYYRETLPNGRSYVVADSYDDGQADNTEVYLVPKGHYFALGDNRDNSQDSRFLDAIGYIPEENFIGPVVFRFWNRNGFSLANRPGEIYPQK